MSKENRPLRIGKAAMETAGIEDSTGVVWGLEMPRFRPMPRPHWRNRLADRMDAATPAQVAKEAIVD